MAPSHLQVACFPQDLVSSQPRGTERLAWYFPRSSKVENYEFVMWRTGWHRNNPRRASWDPAPNLYLVMLDLGHDSMGVPVSSGISWPWSHNHWAPCFSEAGRMRGLEVMLGEASWLDFPVYSFLRVDFSLQQRFSTRGDFSARPSGHLAMPRTFLLVTAEEGSAFGI